MKALCLALDLPRSTCYRMRTAVRLPKPRRVSPRALRPDERQAALDAMHSERFVNGRPVVPSPPKEVWINRPKNEKESENAP